MSASDVLAAIERFNDAFNGGLVAEKFSYVKSEDFVKRLGLQIAER